MIPARRETSANFRRLAARIRGLVGKAIADFGMIGEGDGANVVIRPLCYVPEREIARMLAAWERDSPGRVESIFTALCNVDASHLADPRAFDFAALERATAGGTAP